MSTELIDDGRVEPFPSPDFGVLAEQLVAAARSSGVELTGPGGLLTGLTRHVLETALEVEMSEHLGYERHERSAAGNARSGSTPTTVRTDVGDVRISVPRGRAGTFTPAVVPMHARRLAGFDEAVISLYVKGMTTGDIANHLAHVYGTEVSRDLVSRVTDAVVEQMQSWQNRPLDPVYPVVLIDAIVLKVRDGQVTNRPVYVVAPVRSAFADGEVEDLQGRLLGREVAAPADGLAEPGVERLNPVRCVDQLSNLNRQVQERRAWPGPLPHPHNRRVFVPPHMGEGCERRLRCGHRRCGVDGPELGGDLPPVRFVGVAQAVADQVELMPTSA